MLTSYSSSFFFFFFSLLITLLLLDVRAFSSSCVSHGTLTFIQSEWVSEAGEGSDVNGISQAAVIMTSARQCCRKAAGRLQVFSKAFEISD